MISPELIGGIAYGVAGVGTARRWLWMMADNYYYKHRLSYDGDDFSSKCSGLPC